MTERLMNEILDASNGLGAAVKRREDTHKMAGVQQGLRTLPLVILRLEPAESIRVGRLSEYLI